MKKSVPKIEGHATFYAHLKAGRVDKAQMIGLENDRFVEKILLGRKYNQAPIITSRICGICPTIHNITSTTAVEDALGIKISNQTKALRNLMLCGQMIQSHSLHLYLLVLPDFVGVSSSFELQKEHPDIFENAIILKRYADAILDTVGGRAVHPISSVPGGFKSFPETDQLKKLYKQTDQILKIAEQTISLFNSFEYPKIKRNIIYSAIYSNKKYDIINNQIKTTSGKKYEPKNYKNYIFEELKPYTRAKFGTLKGEEMMVGAAARINLNRKNLHKEVLDQILQLGIKNYFNSPFDNIIAQALENYHFVLESKKIIKHLIDNKIDRKDPVKPPQKFGKGYGACEAPRGTLFHYYEIDDKLDIIGCDIITPTVQNLPALEYDMKNIAPLLKDTNKEERNDLIEFLIRAYDPCITCATH